MEKKSTIQPILTPLKAFYEKLTMQEQEDLQSLSNEVLAEEMKLLEILTDLGKVRKSPSPSSVDIVLRYSKNSKRDFVA